MSKFEVGEVCWLDSRILQKTFEATILAIGSDISICTVDCDYIIEIPKKNNYSESCAWGVMESSLRKKRPPQTDTEIAEEDFIKELNAMIFRDEVKA